MWVPSHVGIKGNEMAREAASLANLNLPTNTIKNISSKHIFTSIHKKIFLVWQHYWDSAPPQQIKIHQRQSNNGTYPQSLAVTKT